MVQRTGESHAESAQEFASRNRLPITNISLLNRALTHRSYINEHPDALEDNERLEFLGDAVLDFVVGVWLYHHFPEMSEGDLTRMRAALVKTSQLAEFGRQIGIGAALRLGRGEEDSGGRSRSAMLCGAFEAVVGALCLDSGMKAVEDFVFPRLEEAVQDILLQQRDRDAKSLLQELVQSDGRPTPRYEVHREFGPDHAKTFEVHVYDDGVLLGQGTGSSKQEASMAAAEDALRIMGYI